MINKSAFISNNLLMFSTMECQRRAAAIQTSSQLSPFTRVTLSNFFLIVVSRIADGSTHLSPLGVCSDIERDPGAGGSVGQPGASPQRLHLQEWSRLDIENPSQLRGEFEPKMSKLLPPIFRSPQSSSSPSSSCRKSGPRSETSALVAFFPHEVSHRFSFSDPAGARQQGRQP